MKKLNIVFLMGGLCLAGVTYGQSEDLLALTTNFGPRRPSTNPPPESTVSPRPAPYRPAPPAPYTVPPTADPATARTLKEEAVRRQEAQIVAQQLISEGLKFYYDAKYEAAIPKFEQALKVLPRAEATQIDYDRAVRGLSDAYSRLADAAYRAGDNDKAKQYAKKSLEYEPTNRLAENILVKIKISEQQAVAKAEREKLEGKKPKALVERPDLDRTPEFKAKQDEIRKLFREARILMNSGQYDEAETRYKQILLIDHYNEDAYKNLQELNSLRLQAAAEGVDATRRQRLWQVAEAWIPSVSGQVKLPEKTAAQPVPAVSAEREKIERKLQSIRFPEINFREAAVSDIVKFLSDESRKLDPTGEGVNIVLGPGAAGEVAPQPSPAPPPAPTPEGAAPAPAPAPAPMPSATGPRTITLSLRNVPMDQALKYITSLANLKYQVESSAVVLLPADAAVGGMVTRSYNVSPDAIRSLIAGGGGGGVAPTPTGMTPIPTVPGAAPGAAAAPAPTAGVSGSEELKKFFQDAGVPFPPGSSLTYFERARTIYVRNTPENLEIFERVLATFNVVPSQVEIEAKFIEITQEDLDELGFQWRLGSPADTNFLWVTPNSGATALQYLYGGGQSLGNILGQNVNPNFTNAVNQGWLTQGLRGSYVFRANAMNAFLVGAGGVSTVADAVGTFRGVLNNAQVEMVINALAQKKSADVLSAPKVTTISGAQAQIRVVQEFIYPSEYSQPTVSEGSVPTPSIPTAFKTREVGVILSVTPTVGADGYTINLTLVPEVSAFLGMLDYSPDPIQGFVRVGGGGVTPAEAAPVSVSYKIWQPLFETRNVTTTVVIWDGQTVVLGGLIREEVNKIDDKIPVLGDIPILGRLFRTKAFNRMKRNLLVFVTARLVDPAGNVINRPNTPGFRFDPAGNPMRGPEPTLTK